MNAVARKQISVFRLNLLWVGFGEILDGKVMTDIISLLEQKRHIDEIIRR
ncbi:MAG: hypothetical protein Ct9H300mP4_12310 [Gammaproteobacteria bacterium]|nr:MAG: hypothetical protein Ct9H300mP4_12310 [Gammaproteobacteria bacterium]